MGNTIWACIFSIQLGDLQDRGMSLSEQHIVLVYDIVHKP